MRITTIRFNESDLDLIEMLRKKLGLVSTTELIRLALRKLAEEVNK
jgi:DNA-binding CsgD family transcriptional regulator